MNPAQRRIADLITHEGLSNAEIADRTGLGLRTVKKYAMHMYRILGVRNRIELARLWPTEIFQIGLEN